MDWGFFPFLADLLSDRGMVTVRFNFSGSGMRPGEDRVSDIDAFSSATHSRDLDELEQVIEALGNSIGDQYIDRERLGLFGHSRGGGTCVLVAGCQGAASPLRSLVTWSAVSTFDRLTADQKSAWRAAGTLPVLNARTGQEIGLDVEVLEDLEENAEKLDILAAAERCRVPWLILHGGDDETVSVGEARKLAERSTADAKLEIIGGGSHTFGATHPFNGPTPQLIAALNHTQSWFRVTLCD